MKIVDSLTVGINNRQEFAELCAQIDSRMALGEEYIISIQPRPFHKGSNQWLRKAVANARAEMGISQNKLASLIGISPEYLSDFETGRGCPGAWKELIFKTGVRIRREAKPSFEFIPFLKKGQIGLVASTIRKELKIPIKGITSSCGITQTQYLDFENGKDLSFDETERVLGYLGFEAT